MRKFQLNKLVRDKIVDEMIVIGDTPTWRKLSQKEYILALKKKLVEESNEVLNASNKDVLDELATTQEVVDALLNTLQISKIDFAKIQQKKNTEKGSFKKKLFVEFLEAEAGSKWANYFGADPKKYPEVKALSKKSPYYFYMLRCADSSLYCGITNDVQSRLKEHNVGKGSKYVRSRLPATLVYAEEHADISSALKREAEVRKWSKIRKEELIKV